MSLIEKLKGEKNINSALKKGDEFMQKSMPKEAVSEYLKSIMKENTNIKQGGKFAIVI